MVQAKMFTECLRIKVMTLYNAYRKKILQKVSLGGFTLTPTPNRVNVTVAHKLFFQIFLINQRYTYQLVFHEYLSQGGWRGVGIACKEISRFPHVTAAILAFVQNFNLLEKNKTTTYKDAYLMSIIYQIV